MDRVKESLLDLWYAAISIGVDILQALVDARVIIADVLRAVIGMSIIVASISIASAHTDNVSLLVFVSFLAASTGTFTYIALGTVVDWIGSLKMRNEKESK